MLMERGIPLLTVFGKEFALAVLDAVEDPGFRARSEEVAARLRAGLERIAAGHPHVGEIRGLGPMLALELVEDLGTRAPAAGLASEVVGRAYDRGLVLLSCGLDANVVRILVPLVAADEELDRGLAILEESLGDGARA